MSSQNTTQFRPNKGKNLEITVGNEVWLRLPIKTGVIRQEDKLFDLLAKFVHPHIKEGDIFIMSEKVLALTQGQLINLNDVKPTSLARFLAHRVKNHYGTKDFHGFGHGTPMAMQLVINEAGVPRVLLAAAVSAITRAFGIKGLFYFICGKRAKSIDCPMSFLIQPYTHYAKLPPIHPEKVAKEIRDKIGCEAVIIDANYRGAFALGISSKNVTEKFAQEVFRDNPLGQSDEMTPFCIVRRK